MTLTPEQLPARVSNFIAYGPEERAPDPTRNGEVITIRPQVYVRYYPTLVVSELKEGGRSGNRDNLVTVHFDPASVGFKDPISAHMNADDRTLPMLRRSLEEQMPLAIGIETQRKKKNSESGAPISPLTPIHALRGATHPNGDGDGRSMMGPSGNNTSNRVAFVQGQPTQHIQSNPAEWKALVNNKAGDLPPEGWRNFAPGDDWTQYGAATRANTPSPGHQGSASGFPSPDQLGGMIRDVVTQALREFAPALANHVTAADPSAGRGRPTGTFTEGKQWEPRTSDGRVNLGGYVVASERWVYEWSHEYLDGSGQDTSPESVWDLTAAVHSMASAVQAQAYGHGFVPDRTSASHREAEKWVQWCITHAHPFPGQDADEQTRQGWAEQVIAEATEFLAEAGKRAGAYFSEVTKRDKNGAAPTSKKADDTPTEPSEKVVRAYLDVIERSWEDPTKLRGLAEQGRNSGYAALPVSLSTTDTGAPSIGYPPAEGAPSGPLDSLLLYRVNELAGQHEAQGGAERDSTAPQSQDPQAQDPQGQGAQRQEEDTAPETTQDPNAPAAQEPDALAGIVERLKAVTDESALRSIYEEVRDGNLTASKVFVAPGPQGEVLFGQEGQDGFQAQGLGYVIGIMRQHLVSGAQAQDQGAPQGESTSAPEQDSQSPQDTPAPEAQSAPEEKPSTDTAPAAETAPATEEPSDDDAQRIADAAENAATLDDLAALRAEAEEKGLTEATVAVGGNEGALGLWIDHQKRRITRAQRKRS